MSDWNGCAGIDLKRTCSHARGGGQAIAGARKGYSSGTIARVILERAVVALVGMDDGACEPVAAALRAEGADVRSAIQRQRPSAFSVPGFDAAVLDIGEDPDPFLGLVASIRDDPRTRSMPLFVLAPAEMLSGRLAGLGPIHIIPAGNLAMLAHGVSDAIVQYRVESEAVERARGLEERLRGALVRLSTCGARLNIHPRRARALRGH